MQYQIIQCVENDIGIYKDKANGITSSKSLLSAEYVFSGMSFVILLQFKL